MGGGAWTTKSFCEYSASAGKIVGLDGTVDYRGYSAGQAFLQRTVHADLDPKNAVRECRDTDEHPRTLPVIVGIDVTGSMGDAAMTVASMLNSIITGIQAKAKDAEFMVMGIGDLEYDSHPIQASQFESDVRIARHLDHIYFEAGGGPNASESYSAVWYFAAHNTDIDCLKRGAKGVIVTIGDEPLNPTLPSAELRMSIGGIDAKDLHIRTEDVYEDARKKYDIFHVHVRHDGGSGRRAESAMESFARVIGAQNVFVTDLGGLPKVITSIVADRRGKEDGTGTETSGFGLEGTATGNAEPASVNSNGEIVW